MRTQELESPSKTPYFFFTEGLTKKGTQNWNRTKTFLSIIVIYSISKSGFGLLFPCRLPSKATFPTFQLRHSHHSHNCNGLQDVDRYARSHGGQLAWRRAVWKALSTKGSIAVQWPPSECVCVCVCVCSRVANTGVSKPLPRAIASCFFSRFSNGLTRWIWRCFILCAFVLNWLQNLCCKSVSSWSLSALQRFLVQPDVSCAKLFVRNTAFCRRAPLFGPGWK